MNIKIISDTMEGDVALRFLLSCGINLEYYDLVVYSKEYLEKVTQSNSVEFWYSGLTMTLSNGTKRTILFIWEKFYDMSSATRKMTDILETFSEDTLIEISKHSLKQSLKRIRKTNINLS